MKYFKNKDILDYLYQNYTKADGLWFLKVEELYGFDKALEIDSRGMESHSKAPGKVYKENIARSFSERWNCR